VVLVGLFKQITFDINIGRMYLKETITGPWGGSWHGAGRAAEWFIVLVKQEASEQNGTMKRI